MSQTENVTMWGPPALIGLALVAYGQNYVGITVLDVIPGLAGVITLAGYSLATATILGVLAIAFAVVIVASELSSEDNPGETLQSAAAAIRAVSFVGIVAIGYYFYTNLYTSPMDAVTSLWWVPLLGVIGWFMFIYLQNRRQVATGTTAINRTQRDVQRSVEEVAELFGATGSLVATAMLALAGGLLVGISNVGDPLLQFAPEMAYLGTVLLGYVSLGGEWRYAWIIPDLSAMQFLAITIGLGFAALVVRNR